MLVWTSHHVLLDGWSLGQVFAEVCEQYAAIAGGRAPGPGRPAAVPRLPATGWRGQDPAAAERYWRGVLAGFDRADPAAVRPAAAARRTGPSPPSRVRAAPRPRSRGGAARGWPGGNGLTVNTVVQGAWALLLSRYSGERDVVFGTTVSGRPAELPGVESMVGMFINTVPTRVTVRRRPGHAVRGCGDLQTGAERVPAASTSSSLAQLQAGATAGRGATCSTASWCSRTTRIDEAAARRRRRADPGACRRRTPRTSR